MGNYVDQKYIYAIVLLLNDDDDDDDKTMMMMMNWIFESTALLI